MANNEEEVQKVAHQSHEKELEGFEQEQEHLPSPKEVSSCHKLLNWFLNQSSICTTIRGFPQGEVVCSPIT